MPSRVFSYAARYQRQAANAMLARAQVAAVSAAALGFQAAREAARINSYMAPEIVLTASDAGDGTATIHVAEHDRVYPVQGTIKVDNVTIGAADITGVAPAAPAIYVYYLDASLADPTPAFLTTTDRIEATNGAQPGLFFVGVVPTPAVGAAATTGTGGTAPTGWPRDYPIDGRYPTP